MSEYVDIHAAARHLKVNESWLYRQCRKGTIPFFKIGKYLRFDISSLNRHLNENCRRGPQVDIGSRGGQQ